MNPWFALNISTSSVSSVTVANVVTFNVVISKCYFYHGTMKAGHNMHYTGFRSK